MAPMIAQHRLDLAFIFFRGAGRQAFGVAGVIVFMGFGGFGLARLRLVLVMIVRLFVGTIDVIDENILADSSA